MKRLALVGFALALVGCSSAPERPEPTELDRIDDKVALSIQWNEDLGASAEQTAMLWPAVQGDRIYAAAGETLMALDAAGSVVWEQSLEQPVSGGVTAIGNQVVLSDAMGSIRAFNSANGQATWSWDWGRETIVPATAGQNGLLVRSTDESVALIDFQGNPLWQRQGTPARLAYRGQARPLAVDGGYVLPNDSGEVMALLAQDGLNAWRRSLAGVRGELVDLDASPVIAANSIIIGGAQTGLSALDPASGSVRWDVEVFSLLPLATDEQAIYATDLDGQVVAVNAASGEILWRQTGLKFRFPSGPIATDAGIMVVDSLGVGHLLDTQNGAFIGRVKTGLSGAISLTAIEQDVLAMDNSGRLSRIGIDN